MYGSRGRDSVSTHLRRCHHLESEAVQTEKYFGIFGT